MGVAVLFAAHIAEDRQRVLVVHARTTIVVLGGPLVVYLPLLFVEVGEEDARRGVTHRVGVRGANPRKENLVRKGKEDCVKLTTTHADDLFFFRHGKHRFDAVQDERARELVALTGRGRPGEDVVRTTFEGAKLFGE